MSIETGTAPAYRLTEDEYLLHLFRAGDPSPESTLVNVRSARGQWVVDGAHGTSADSGDGFIWTRTNNLLVAI